MRNTLWTFGDSFTAGSGLVEHKGSFEPNWQEGLYDQYIFPVLAANHYDLDLQNKGLPGESNQAIINHLIDLLPQINTGDVVIIGLTDSFRFPVPCRNHTNVVLTGGSIEQIQNYISNRTPVLGPNRCITETYSKAHLQSIIDFYLTIFPRFDDYYFNRYADQARGIQQFLIKMGVNCIVWNSTIWDLFENIKTWTRNLLPMDTVEDGHWSPNGHSKFFEVLKYAFEDNVLERPKTIDCGYVHEYYDKFPDRISIEDYVKPSKNSII